MKKIYNFIKTKKNIIFGIICIIAISIFSFSVAPKTLQNDTYYTVSIGNLIMEKGIDMKDHFSWHEDLPYTYPHWLYDVFMSIVYNIGNWNAVYISVCVMSIFLGLSLYYTNKKLNKNRTITVAITIGVMYLLKDYIAARAQLATYIIYVWVIYFMERFIENPKKIRYAIGIILSSILIANLHVAVWPFLFVISLPYIAEYMVGLISDVVIYNKISILKNKLLIKKYKNKEEKVKAIKEKLNKRYEKNKKIKKVRENEEPYKIINKFNKNVKWLILVMLICGLTGFLTPIGTTPYTYLIKTMNGNTIDNINEHLPLTLINNIPVMCTLLIVLSILIFTKAKIRLSDLFMLGGLTYMMFSARRQSAMFAIIGSFILNRMIVNAIEIYKEDSTNSFFNVLLKFTGTIAILVSLYYGVKFIDNKKESDFVNESSYPVEAANWILENLDVNNIRIFNEYNYGSYLLYRGIPVFIDSRADLYAPEFNGKKDIFMDFINTSNLAVYYGKTFKEYNITHVILYKNAKIRMLIDEAEPQNYNKIYSDKNFVIYEVDK